MRLADSPDGDDGGRAIGRKGRVESRPSVPRLRAFGSPGLQDLQPGADPAAAAGRAEKRWTAVANRCRERGVLNDLDGPTPAPGGKRNPRATFGLVPLLASEALAAVVGFGVLIVMARRLGPGRFAAVESAAAVVAVLLVMVRSGVEQVIIREASRRPRLIGPLTETLISLKLACASVAFLGILAMSGGQVLLAIAGLVLFPSALVADVGPRVRRSLGPVAISQSMRSLGLLSATFVFVHSPADAMPAAGCVAIAESVAAIVLGVVHCRDFGIPRLRIRWRAWLILGRRGAVASLSRLGRVVLYGADLLVLAALSRNGFGPYAASRRVVFAMIAVGLVLPGAFAPSIASAWSRGVEPARRAISMATFGLMNLAAPAAIGLMMTAEGWMRTLFGADYRGGGLALAIVAARAPFLLAASLHQASLVAIRRETASLRIVLLMLALAAVAIPVSCRLFGPLGVGIAMVGVELCGAVAGWIALRRLAVSPSILHVDRWAILGTLAMIVAVLSFRHCSVWEASLAGAASLEPRGSSWAGETEHGRPDAGGPGVLRSPGACGPIALVARSYVANRLGLARHRDQGSRGVERPGRWLRRGSHSRPPFQPAGDRQRDRIGPEPRGPRSCRFAADSHPPGECLESPFFLLPIRSRHMLRCLPALAAWRRSGGGLRVDASRPPRRAGPDPGQWPGVWPDRSISARLFRLSELVDGVRFAGLHVLKASYVNCLPAVASEVAGRLRKSAGSGHPAGRGLRIDVPSPWKNRVMRLISGAECVIAGRLGGRLPVGHSTMVLARRPNEEGRS